MILATERRIYAGVLNRHGSMASCTNRPSIVSHVQVIIYASRYRMYPCTTTKKFGKPKNELGTTWYL